MYFKRETFNIKIYWLEIFRKKNDQHKRLKTFKFFRKNHGRFSFCTIININI